MRGVSKSRFYTRKRKQRSPGPPSSPGRIWRAKKVPPPYPGGFGAPKRSLHRMAAAGNPEHFWTRLCAVFTGRISSPRSWTRSRIRPCSPVPHPPQRKARASRFWALRSRLGAGGARRLTPPHIAQQRFKNQKPFSKENQRAPGLTPPSPAGNSSRTTFKACNLAQHRTRGLQSDWSASQTEKSTQNTGSRTRISGFKKRESPRQEAFSLNVRLMVRLAQLF